MRIVMLNHNVGRAGTYWRCFHLARGLVARGHDVTLFTKHATARFRVHRRRDEGVSVVATPRGVLGRVHLGEIGVLDIVPRVLHVTLRRPDVLMAFGAQPDAAIPFFVSKRLRARSCTTRTATTSSAGRCSRRRFAALASSGGSSTASGGSESCPSRRTP